MKIPSHSLIILNHAKSFVVFSLMKRKFHFILQWECSSGLKEVWEGFSKILCVCVGIDTLNCIRFYSVVFLFMVFCLSNRIGRINDVEFSYFLFWIIPQREVKCRLFCVVSEYLHVVCKLCWQLLTEKIWI